MSKIFSEREVSYIQVISYRGYIETVAAEVKLQLILILIYIKTLTQTQEENKLLQDV